MQPLRSACDAVHDGNDAGHSNNATIRQTIVRSSAYYDSLPTENYKQVKLEIEWNLKVIFAQPWQLICDEWYRMIQTISSNTSDWYRWYLYWYHSSWLLPRCFVTVRVWRKSPESLLQPLVFWGLQEYESPEQLDIPIFLGCLCKIIFYEQHEVKLSKTTTRIQVFL